MALNTAHGYLEELEQTCAGGASPGPPLFFQLVLSITSIILIDFLKMIKLILTYG